MGVLSTMLPAPAALSDADRKALLALWAVPEVGPAGLAALAVAIQGRWGELLDAPTATWAHHVERGPSVRNLLDVGLLSRVWPAVVDGAARAKMRIVFRGEDGYPARLAEVAEAPPLLFAWGEIGPPRRRVALVGSRHPAPEVYDWARAFAAGVARGGAGVISGAAAGVDRACHLGALDARGETWAFLGSALDEIDAGARRVVDRVLAGGGVVFSELPPGVRASRHTFPQRNRLIAGASDAVVVLRAARRSGSLHTAEAALRQGRPLLAVPGEVARSDAKGTNWMIASLAARACLVPEDALRAAGVQGPPPPPPERVQLDLNELSAAARAAYAALTRDPRTFEDVQGASRLDPGVLASALTELELLGFVQQGPGKLYERV